MKNRKPSRSRGHARSADDRRHVEDGERLDGESGLIVGHYGIAVDVRLDSGERATLRVRRDAGHMVGERVTVTSKGLRGDPVERVLRRRDSRARVRAVAAGLDFLAVVVAAQPETPSGFVDRACAGAAAAGIEPLLVVNKADVEGADEVYAEFCESHGASMDVLKVSALAGGGLDRLRDRFASGLRGAFIGTSGVGKSSIANALVPELSLDVGEINVDTGLGRHVTTNATLHFLESGGELVDTPGFRDFGPVDLSAAELARVFVGFGALLDSPCRFRDCRHLREPGCEIRAALEAGRLERNRYDTYVALLAELEADEARTRVQSRGRTD